MRTGCQFDDEWTPKHLMSGKTNLYKEIAVGLKGAEWRQPGLVAFANKLATSAGPRKPINIQVPASYEPKSGPNPWRARGGAESVPHAAAPSELAPVGEGADGAAAQRAADGAACTGSQVARSQALPEPVGAAQASEARVTAGAAAALRAPPPRAAPPPRPPDEVELGSGSMLGRARGESLCGEHSVVFAPMSGPAAAPARNNPVAELISRRLSGLFSAPEASQRLEA
jgi:hypothetical protein